MSQRRVLIIGGSFAGLCAARALRDKFLVTVVDAKEFFEYTPGILRAYVKPEHLDALTFTLYPVIETKMGCKFIWGEVTKLDGPNRTCTIKPRFTDSEEVVDFDFCIIAAGCNFGVFHPAGESLWFPTIHDQGRAKSDWKQFDERFLEGRRRHILAEHEYIKGLAHNNSKVLVVGAGFIGVEWVTELNYYFPSLKLTIIDFLPNCLGPLPAKAAAYCERYMKKKNINTVYNTKYAPDSQEFWDVIKLPTKCDKQYVCIGVKASNYFMPEETLSKFGPGGGKWILINLNLGVKTATGEAWGVDEKQFPRVFAVGDCNYGCVEPIKKTPDEKVELKNWPCPPIAKISYPGEEQAVIALKNVIKIDKLVYTNENVGCCGRAVTVHNMHWPWGAGMFATSLGPKDACFVAGANWEKGSGWLLLRGRLSAWQKEIIESTKVNECAMGIIGRLIWHYVHHTPVHLFGRGPMWGY